MALRSHSNEGPSSDGNMHTEEPTAKKQRSGGSNCHQCHRTKYRVVRCTKCKLKYCTSCITRWYTGMDENDFADACAGCRNICNCAGCLHDVANKALLDSGSEVAISDRIEYSKHIIRVLLPTVKQFVVEQNMEKEEEARMQGSSTAEILFPGEYYVYNVDDEGICYNCKTSIFDIYRGCEICPYKLCITCSREIRDAVPWDTFGEAPMTMDRFNAIPKWILTENGTISCPLNDMGGCGCGNLVLKSTYPDNWVSQLLMKAESVPEVCKLPDGLGLMEGPAVVSVDKGDQIHFQWHLHRGEPLIVPNVLCGTTGLSWESKVMWRACRKFKTDNDLPIMDFRAINCSNWCEETINMHHFFEGYRDGLFDNEGRRRILKVEQWPPAESLRERMPRHFMELLRCLPFKHYTHPLAGYLNLSSAIHEISLIPDLEPKMCFACGVEEELGLISVTNLHYALSDRVNILLNTAERFNGAEGGAVWDVFRRQDVPKLEEYLRRHYQELRHTSLLQQVAHPIHDKAFYLTAEHKSSLKEEFGIQPWTFVQKLGDAVVVPAGCPHQIRNLKSCTSAVVSFISPESVGECIRLSTEYRLLPDSHRCKEDKLQVKKMTLDAISDAVHYLDTNAPSTYRTPVTTPVDEHQDPAQSLERPSLAFLRNELERMLLTKEKLGPRIDKYKKAYLEKATKDLVSRIYSAQESSSSK